MKNEDAKAVIFAVLMLAGAYLYYKYNIAVSSAVFVLSYLLARHAIRQDSHEVIPAEKPEKAAVFLLCVSAVMIGLHLYGALDPVDFHEDEWIEIINPYLVINGKMDFFHYAAANGSSLPYTYRALVAVFLQITRTVDYLRLIPCAVYLLTCGVFYLLGCEIKGKKLGAAMLLAYAASSFSYYLSKQMMVSCCIPLFLASGLLLFLIHVRTKKNAPLAGFVAVLFSGFFTYSVWFITVPFWAAAIYIYREELGKKNTAVLSAAVFAAIAAAAAIYLMVPNTVARTLGILTAHSGSGTGLFQNILSRVASVPTLLFIPLGLKYNFAADLPLLSFGEAVLLAAGVYLLVMGRKNKISVLLLCGLFFSMFSLAFNSQMHQLRNVVFYSFIVVVSGFFLDYMTDRKHCGIFMAFFLGFSIWVFADINSFWGDRLEEGDAGKRIAEYIKSEYKNRDAMVLHEVNPYGLFGVALRIDGLRTDNFEKDRDVVVLSNFFMMDALKKAYAASLKKVFYDYKKTAKMPVAVYEISVKEPGAVEALVKMKYTLAGINALMWDYNFRGAIKACDAAEIKEPSNDRDRFLNTVLRAYKLEAYHGMSNARGLYDTFYKNESIYFNTADFYYYRGKTAQAYGDIAAAVLSFEKARAMAPWWDSPEKKLRQLREKTVK